MKSGFCICLALGFVTLAQAPSLAQWGEPRDRAIADHGWLASLEEGKAQARKNGKPLMVVVRCWP
jgi:hypothetical protein